MNKEDHRRWEIVAGFAAPVLTMLGIIVGLCQFSLQERHQREREITMLLRSDSLEFKRRIWEKRQEKCIEICNLAGSIAALAGVPSDRNRFLDNIRRFDALRWGSMVALNDSIVERCMKDFRQEVRDYTAGITSSPDRMKIMADSLGRSCLRGFEHGWFASPY